ncbi:MAG: hypothetical protein A2234_01835 [Elusimicrobia bacterium RIFOXYA2_FULL_58_8]|nr:MAG: hypothetical protein A2234_01835 [Elusimicrobia bacterium RIFOXYA2_FULL_58_8]
MKKISQVFTVLMLVPALALLAQTAPKKNVPPKKITAAQKAAPAPAAAAKPAVKPAAKPAVKTAPKPAVAVKTVDKSTQAAPAPAVEPPAADPFAEAVAGLKAEDPVARRQAATFLGQSRDPKAAPVLVGALTDAAAPVRQAAVEGLGLLTWREAGAQISGLLTQDPDEGVRQQAAISLSYLMDPQSGPALVKALGDASPAVRYAATHTLGALKYKPAEGEIAAMLRGTNINVLRSAIAALGMIQSAKAAPAIIDMLKHQDQYVRIEAARALGEIRDASAAPELKNNLGAEASPTLRVEAALALAKLGFNDGLPVAREFLASPDLSLKSQALNVIVTAKDVDSLARIEELSAADANPVSKGMLDFSLQRLKDIQAAQSRSEALAEPAK